MRDFNLGKETANNTMKSPDFKGVTGKLRLVKRRKRSSILSTSLTTQNSAEGMRTPPLAVRGDKLRNPFRIVNSPSVDDSYNTSDSFVIPKTPEKSTPIHYSSLDRSEVSHNTPADDADEFVIPSTPERDSDIQQSKRRRLTSEEYSLVSRPSPSADLIPLQSKAATGCTTLPIDYSICTKVRITSSINLSSLTRCDDDSAQTALHHFITNNSQSEAEPQFHKYLHYWSYPNLPWLNLYPRKENHTIKQSPLPPSAYSSLDVQWKESLQSTLRSLISEQLTCGYFYILCEGFTVLYKRCSKCRNLSAVVSPTSRGFRQNLQARGIEFIMPVPDDSVPLTESTKPSSAAEGTTPADKSNRKRSSTGSSRTDIDSALLDLQTENPGAEEEEETDDPLEFLEGIGLDKSHFPSLRSAKVKQEEESFRRIDYRPASTLLIRGEEMMSRLTKFLIEYDKTKATTGQLANIPPTIISLSPFLHANIEKLQHRCGQMMVEDGERQNYIDITGPILPHVANHIISDVIIPSSTNRPTLNISSIRVTNSHVFNIRTCEEQCNTIVQSSAKLIKSVLYKQGLYYIQ